MIKYHIGIGIISLMVLGVIIYGFVTMGGPGQARREKFDQTRINDLNLIQRGIRNYFLKNNVLPSNLTELDPAGLNLTDPETGAPYFYQKKPDGIDYQLCANFDTANLDEKNTYPPAYGSVIYGHQKGYQCFDLNAKPEF